MKLSIVATLYQSALYLAEFYARSRAVAQQLVGTDYEIVLVNDGSPDNSLALAIGLTETDPRVRVIDLARNFGHHKAMMTGLAHSQGNLVFLLDSDLEEEPEWLPHFAAQLNAEAADMVYGVQGRRKGTPWEQLTGTVFYKAFRALTGVAQPDNIVTARLMTRRYVDALLAHQERELNIGGLWIVTGFKQCQHTVHKHATSPTTYTFRRKLSHFITAVVSFSNRPLAFTLYAGVLLTGSAIAYIATFLFCHLVLASPPTAASTIIAALWLCSGLIIFFLGVQGIYIATIFSEVKQRPYTIIRHIYQQPSLTADIRLSDLQAEAIAAVKQMDAAELKAVLAVVSARGN